MQDVVETVIENLEQGKLTRRQAVAGLTALVAAALGAPRSLGAEAGSSTFRAVGLNHLALRVTDLERSMAFYRKHLGLGVLRSGSRNAFLSCGGNNFLALFKAQTAGIDHYCFTVPDYDAGATVKTLEGAGLSPQRHEDRVYFDDPDGITVQLSGEWDDYPGERPGS